MTRLSQLLAVLTICGAGPAAAETAAEAFGVDAAATAASPAKSRVQPQNKTPHVRDHGRFAAERLAEAAFRPGADGVVRRARAETPTFEVRPPEEASLEDVSLRGAKIAYVRRF